MINSIGITNTNSYATQSISTAAAPKTGEAEFSYNPQDKLVMEPVTTGVEGVTQRGRAPQTDRVALKTDLKPNADGKYVFDRSDAKNYTSAHSFATVANTLNTFEEAYGDKIPWATRNEQIKLVPDGGEMLNAYYSRNDGSVNFFHAMDTVTNEMVYSGQSGEVVSHEVGHAMLDGLRPGYLSAWSPDPGGFHESFADLMGMFMSTQEDSVCELVANQTGGDMQKPNSLAMTGEELGTTINNVTGKNNTGGSYIRNAINDFKWQDPSTLPENPHDSTKLGTEMHSWSRVFTGAVYDAFGGIVSREMEGGMSAKEAIKEAGSQCIQLYGHLLKEAPKGDFTYKQMANCMLKADQEQMGGKNGSLLRDSFVNRKILPDGVNMLENADTGAKETRMMSVTLDGDGFGMFSGAKVDTPVDASKVYASADNEAANDLKGNMKRLIDSGRILYTEPNQKLEHKDLFDKDGMPYMGVVRWVDGDMVIERNNIIN